MNCVKWINFRLALSIVIEVKRSRMDSADYDEIFAQLEKGMGHGWMYTYKPVYFDKEEQELCIDLYLMDPSDPSGKSLAKDSPEMIRFMEKVKRITLEEAPPPLEWDDEDDEDDEDDSIL